ncbi:MAG: DUF3142 domain-containing protein [Deltaproteobacteria bacterium]|nr:DUF3142 domain-containing protein [Deltaproteobacteria bacterium]
MRLVATTPFLLTVAAHVGGCAPAIPQRSTADAAVSQVPAADVDVYVWRRRTSDALAASLAALPPSVARVRVLVEETGGRAPGLAEVDAGALGAAGRPVVAVWRIDGRALPEGDAAVDAVLARVRALRERGLSVVGLEVDHDCPTARLPAYDAWLRRVGPGIRADGLRLGITALPTWLDAPGAIEDLASAVDDLTLQVHAVRAPVLFDADQAARDVRRFAAAAGRAVDVALPAYDAVLDGVPVRTAPSDVARALGALRAPGSGARSFVFFRLGADDDVGAWSPRTVQALATAAPLVADVGVSFVSGAGGAVDVVVTNQGNVAARAPARIALDTAALGGAGADADGVASYQREGRALVSRARPSVRPGDRIVVGWLRPAYKGAR